MRRYLDIPNLPIHAFKKRGFGQNLATLEGGGGSIGDVFGLTNTKIGDPLGLTHTKIGDPLGLVHPENGNSLTGGPGKGGKSSGAPAYPDPYKIADAQTQANEQSAAYNKALNTNNYTNPFGSQQSRVVGTDPKTGAPIYQTDITANPELQSQMSSLLGELGGANKSSQNAMNGLFGISSGLTDKDANGMTQAQNAYYNSAKSYLDPQYSQQEEQLKSSLANQGLTPGSEAYNNAMGNFSRDKDFAYNQAMNSAITQGQQLGLNTANTQGALLGQAAGLSQIPYSNLQTIAQMIPGYSGTSSPTSQPANIGQYMNNQYQSQLAGYNAQQQTNNALMNGLFSIGAAMMRA
jgi:hypothetical protein